MKIPLSRSLELEEVSEPAEFVQSFDISTKTFSQHGRMQQRSASARFRVGFGVTTAGRQAHRGLEKTRMSI